MSKRTRSAPAPPGGGIYLITNLINGKFYVGSAISFRSRWAMHRKKLKAGTHANKHLSGAWKIYGADAFLFEVLEVVSKTSLLIEREQFWLDHLQAANTEFGYNLRREAKSNLGLKASEETRKLLSEQRRGNKHALGTKQSRETIEKRRLKLIGQKRHFKPERSPAQLRADESRRRLMTGRPNPMTGKTRSEEFKRKISAAFKGRISPLRGRKLPPEHLANIKKGWIAKHYRFFAGLVAPSGTRMPPIYDMAAFCRRHGLAESHLRQVIKGKRKSHKGWTCMRESTEACSV